MCRFSEDLVKKNCPRVMDAVTGRRYQRVGFAFLSWTEQTHLLNRTWPHPMRMSARSPWLSSLPVLLSRLFRGQGESLSVPLLSLLFSLFFFSPLFFFLIFLFRKILLWNGKYFKIFRSFSRLGLFLPDSCLVPTAEWAMGNVSFLSWILPRKAWQKISFIFNLSSLKALRFSVTRLTGP